MPKKIRKAVVDVTIRVVVHDDREVVRDIESSVDDFLERALHSNTDVLTEGLVDAHHINTIVVHEWDEYIEEKKV